MINVICKRCEQHKQNARYGTPGNSPTHCSECKMPGMIPRPKRICSECRTSPKSVALYGTNEHKRCEAHKQPDDINLVEQDCKQCKLVAVVDCNGYCGTCHPEFVKRFHLRKQRELKQFLDSRGFKYEIYDRQIDNGACGRERPDFVFDGTTHKVVLENDENQHKPYKCEEVRMKNITSSMGMSTLHIRFNCDAYKPGNGDREVPKNQRFDDLARCITHYCQPDLTLNSNDVCRVIYMYYDGYTEASPLTVQRLDMQL
jgi:hypothetical protein